MAVCTRLSCKSRAVSKKRIYAGQLLAMRMWLKHSGKQLTFAQDL